MKIYHKYILVCLSLAILFLFESCVVCSRNYKTDLNLNSPYQDTKFITADSLIVSSGMKILLRNKSHLLKGRPIIYHILIQENYESNLDHSNDTIMLNSFVITDEKGDTIQTTLIRGMSKKMGDTISSIPYCFIFNDDSKKLYLHLIMISEGYWKMPKSLFISYDLKINNSVLIRDNIKYEYSYDFGARRIIELPIAIVFRLTEYFRSNEIVNSIYSHDFHP